jgi:uncharacterized protein (DUF302 family)
MAIYPYRTEVSRPFDETVAATRAALVDEGFGVLTEVDVTATFKEKLDRDFKPYIILGACNPPNAWKVLQEEEEIGLFLPCNVVVFEDSPGHSVVTAVNPEVAMQPVGNERLAPMAADIGGRLQRVIKSVGSLDTDEIGAA